MKTKMPFFWQSKSQDEVNFRETSAVDELLPLPESGGFDDASLSCTVSSISFTIDWWVAILAAIFSFWRAVRAASRSCRSFSKSVPASGTESISSSVPGSTAVVVSVGCELLVGILLPSEADELRKSSTPPGGKRELSSSWTWIEWKRPDGTSARPLGECSEKLLCAVVWLSALLRIEFFVFCSSTCTISWSAIFMLLMLAGNLPAMLAELSRVPSFIPDSAWETPLMNRDALSSWS